jgi:hypothetical protein
MATFVQLTHIVSHIAFAMTRSTIATATTDTINPTMIRNAFLISQRRLPLQHRFVKMTTSAQKTRTRSQVVRAMTPSMTVNVLMGSINRKQKRDAFKLLPLLQSHQRMLR